MFDNLSSKFGDIFDRLRGRGALSEKDVAAALREIRVALLEADVSLSVVKQFIDVVREEAVGQAVLKSVTPGQMVVKIVHDQLIKMLGPEDAKINLNASPPVPIMLVGLQGAGKTTTAGKLASHLRNKENKRVLLAGLDVARPAAQEQLLVHGRGSRRRPCNPCSASSPSGSQNEPWKLQSERALTLLFWTQQAG